MRPCSGVRPGSWDSATILAEGDPPLCTFSGVLRTSARSEAAIRRPSAVPRACGKRPESLGPRAAHLQDPRSGRTATARRALLVMEQRAHALGERRLDAGPTLD